MQTPEPQSRDPRPRNVPGRLDETRTRPRVSPVATARTLVRRVGTASALLALLALLSSPAGAAAHRKRHGPIYFFTSPSAAIDSDSPLVIEPRDIPLFLDGQWVLQDLRWTGWGSPVARATGISSSSNDNPNAAQGKRIKTWAKVTLSKPGRFEGHKVYRCFAVRVPPPASYSPTCLRHVGSTWIFDSVRKSG